MFKHYQVGAVILLSLLLCFQNLSFYFVLDFRSIIVLGFLPFVLYVRKSSVTSFRYAFISLALLCLYPFIKIQSLFFIGYCCFILFVIESTYGKLNNLPIFALLLLSPLSSYLFNVFGFAIRLQLTVIAEYMLSFVYHDISSSGNLIMLYGKVYKVAPECMGLNLLTTGFILSLFLIANREKQTAKYAGFAQTVLLMCFSFVLIVISNLMRIIGIVVADAAADTALHELLGLFCLLIYTIVPMYFIVKLFSKKFYPISTTTPTTNATTKKKLVLQLSVSILLLIVLGTLNYKRDSYRNDKPIDFAGTIEIEGFEKELIQKDILKLSNQQCLIYIKPSIAFYGADHSPLICWKGSGYQFSEEKEIVCNGQTINYAVLENKQHEKIHTAWWYDNGKHKTNSQLEWRWNTMKGSLPYYLVNISCQNYQELLDTITQQEHILKIIDVRYQ